MTKKKLKELTYADTLYDKFTSLKKVLGKDPNNAQDDGESIKKKLDIEDEKRQNIADKAPLKVMDIVYQIWGVKDSDTDGQEEEEDGDEEVG